MDCQQKAFDTLKSVVATDCLNAYPNYNKPFEIYTDASNYQLGAAIIQDKRHIAYWSILLEPTKMKYTTTEKELLAIILCLKEYEQILYGATINIYTDHKNLLSNATEIMLNYPPLASQNPLLNKNPLDLELIQSHQQKDNELQKAVQEDKTFFILNIRDVS